MPVRGRLSRRREMATACGAAAELAVYQRIVADLER